MDNLERLIAIDADGNLPEGAWDTLASADAIIFGAPTYMGSASGQFKTFADASSTVAVRGARPPRPSISQAHSSRTPSDGVGTIRAVPISRGSKERRILCSTG